MDGAITGDRVLAFVREALLPALRPGDVVVMANLSAHTTRTVRVAFAEAGVAVLDRPRYRPEYNPIELCRAVAQTRRRDLAARTREALRVGVAGALATIDVEQVERWVRHGAYRLSSKPSCLYRSGTAAGASHGKAPTAPMP